jgi:hypothetical protein
MASGVAVANPEAVRQHDRLGRFVGFWLEKSLISGRS